MIQNILTPIDGSDHADVALDVASDIAGKFDAHLRLLHVGLRQHRGRIELFHRASQSFERAEREGKWTSDNKNWPRELQILDHMGHLILQEGAARARKRGVRSVDTKIDWGDESERILHHSQHPVADMIVMGSRGLSPLQGLFLGSVSHKVFHLAECTCATVHAGRDHPGLERLDRVLIAHDGSDHAKKALELGADLAARFDAEVVLLHVTLRNASAEQLLRSCDPDHLDGATRQNLERAVEDSAVAVGGVPAWIPLVDSDIESVGKCILAEAEDTARANGVAKVTSKVVDGDPARCILDAAEHESADSIVMGMRGLGEVAGMLVGSVSYKVSHLARATCIAVR